MYLADSHTHTKYSFDGPQDKQGEVDSLCEAAIERGLSEIAITDHLDINGVVERIYPDIDCDSIRRDVLAAKEKYAGRLYVCYGIELGQAMEYPTEAREFIEKYQYEFVIGSLHNYPGVPDYSFIDYTQLTDKHIEKLFRSSIDGLCSLCDFDGLNTIAHFTYMHRYVRLKGRSINFDSFYPEIKAFYKKLIESGKALEINTSTLRSGADMTMPTYELMRLYRECGGELVTCGSDSHGSEFVGCHIKDVYDFLASAGFKYVTVFHDGKPQMNKIN